MRSLVFSSKAMNSSRVKTVSGEEGLSRSIALPSADSLVGLYGLRAPFADTCVLTRRKKSVSFSPSFGVHTVRWSL